MEQAMDQIMKRAEFETIVFFDGYCGLCSGVVDFMIARDSNERLLFSPLQGETARSCLSEQLRNDLDSVIVVRRNQKGAVTITLKKRDAVLEALRLLNSTWAAFARAAQVLPRPIRDAVYDVVAKNRFKLFGRRDSCRAPTENERKRFRP
jgi:predicted DCC family thiol-disulfide oxidoreductase YuxK